MKKISLLLAAAAATAAFWPAAGSAATGSGVVVAKQRGVLLVAASDGTLRAVHAKARIGAVLSGTHVVGSASRATIRGVVVRRIGTTLVLSSNRHLIAIPNRVGRRLADTAPAPTPPTAPGTVVNATVSIAHGELEETNEDDVGHVNANALTIQAVVASVAPGSVTVNVQGHTLAVPLPAGLTLPTSIVGQTVTFTVALDDHQNRDDNDDNGDDNGNDHGGNGGHGGDDHGGSSGHGGDGGGDD